MTDKKIINLTDDDLLKIEQIVIDRDKDGLWILSETLLRDELIEITPHG